MPPTERRLLGSAGEGHARRYLETRGFRFECASWRGGGGEIDLILWDEDELVFVEVKTRRGERSGRAEEAVTAAQSRRLLLAADAYVADLESTGAEPPIWRVDLIAITLSSTGAVASVRHFENAVVSG